MIAEPKHSTSDRPIELLAPAGGLDAGLAAFQFGADAIYLGLKRFSARAEADNFTLEELDSIVGYAHAQPRRRRVFAAVNTLIREAELPALVDTLGSLVDIGVDAIIVQDLGVARLVRRHFRELEMHASTQLAVHNREGVEALRDQGFQRVTLARELSLAELRTCAAVPGVEVEAFIHGALCYAYSGICLFSAQIVGRSGNRGQCAYPCRDRWRVADLSERSPGPGLSTEARSGFAFSMKDLAAPQWLPAMRQAGVACLKIEGRKKSPLYVATTVDFYRKLLDGELHPKDRAAHEADLRAVFSRPWTELYLRSPRNRDVADRDIVGHRGSPIGRIDAVARRGGAFWVRFKSSRALARHDGLQIDVAGLDRPFGFPVGTLRLLPASRQGTAREVVESPPGAVVEVALPEGHPTLSVGAPIYCSSSQEVKKRYQRPRPNLRSYRSRLGIRVEASLDDRALRVHVSLPARSVEVDGKWDGPYETAGDSSKMARVARESFDKLGDTRFWLEGLDWQNPEGRFVPVSRLNEIRRALVERLESAVCSQAARRRGSVIEELSGSPFEPCQPVSVQELRWSIQVDRLDYLEGFEPRDWAELEEVIVDVGQEPRLTLLPRLEALAARVGRERIRLSLPAVTRQWESRALRAKIADLHRAGFDCWQAANVSAWSFLAPSQRGRLTADWSVYVSNSEAARQAMEMGACGLTLSPDDSLENTRALLSQLGERATVIVFQDTPLFVSESCPYANLRGGCVGPSRCRYQSMELVSSHGGKVLALNRRCRTVVVNEKPYCVTSHLHTLASAGARKVRADFMYRPYSLETVRQLWRSLRRGEAISGHLAHFEAQDAC